MHVTWHRCILHSFCVLLCNVVFVRNIVGSSLLNKRTFCTFINYHFTLIEIILLLIIWVTSQELEDGFGTGCWNISCQQQSFFELQSPRWSFSIKVCYSWVQTIFLICNNNCVFTALNVLRKDNCIANN